MSRSARPGEPEIAPARSGVLGVRGGHCGHSRCRPASLRATLGPALEAWLRTHEAEETTLDGYRGYVRRTIVPALGGVPIGNPRTRPEVNARRNVPSVNGARVLVNSRGMPPWRSRSMSLIESAPATTPSTRDITLAAAWAPAVPGRVSRRARRLGSPKEPSPGCHVRAPVGVFMPNKHTFREDTMAPRVPKTELTGFTGSVIKRFSRRLFGRVPESIGVAWNNPDVFKAGMSFGRRVQKWDQADESLKSFAHMAVAAQVGCSWCLDFNYFQAQNKELDLRKASQVPRWRESDVFTPLERDVLEYAEAMTNTPPTVTDKLSDRLLANLGAAALVELNAVIGFANYTTRCNTALGIESEGYSDACEVPLAARPQSSRATSAP